MSRLFWMTVGMSLALGLGSGCDANDCPAGQVLFDGECVDVIPQIIECGPGTYNDSGLCRPHEDLCGPNTEVVWVEDASGVQTEEFYCEGQRISDVPPCPPSPDGQLICVSGWARHLMDPVNPCNIMETAITFGPDATALEVAIYNPLAYASAPDPSTVAPLGVAEVNPEDGTWKVENIEVPTTGFIAVVVRSVDPSTEFIFTGFPYAAAAGQNLEEVAGYGVTAAQNAAWTASIGDTAIAGATHCESGDSLFDCGTWIGVFGYAEDNGRVRLLEGVTPWTNGAAVPVNDTLYLEDTCDAFTQPTSLTDSYTTSTGVVFYPGARLGNFWGTCADLNPDSECEAEAYTFDQLRLGGAGKQAIFVELMYPEGLE